MCALRTSIPTPTIGRSYIIWMEMDSAHGCYSGERTEHGLPACKVLICRHTWKCKVNKPRLIPAPRIIILLRTWGSGLLPSTL